MIRGECTKVCRGIQDKGRWDWESILEYTEVCKIRAGGTGRVYYSMQRYTILGQVGLVPHRNILEFPRLSWVILVFLHLMQCPPMPFTNM